MLRLLLLNQAKNTISKLKKEAKFKKVFMDKLLIGTVLKPQGIRGELKIKNYTDDFYAISALKEVFIDNACWSVPC